MNDREICEKVYSWEEFDIYPVLNRNICCIFHSESSPSARFYQDDDCIRLHCYAEHRQFTVYDYIVKVLEGEPSKMLTAKLGHEQYQYLKKQQTNKIIKKQIKTIKVKDIEEFIVKMMEWNV